MKKFVKFSEVRNKRNQDSQLETPGMSKLKGGAATLSKRCPYIGTKYGICPPLDPNTKYGICQYNYQCKVSPKYGIETELPISAL
ncbi:MAG: hypothetical protein GY765_02770 [bacterium]|nr:hypothetical protein [bacterium]